ncbi:cytochrome c3 family protein [Shewanella sp. TC10]|uniref:cytochrome c3 family protein n=1 Tax=Shewanella sp. TC10 TaxID=1419739 RepID=UPI00129D5CC7|nr:cytochrome c3 family protein [Shewanella sp. TC10]
MLKVLGLSILLSFSGAAFAESIADTHTDMAGCEACHMDGEPSADMAYENQTCIDCHGGLDSIEGEIHQQHDGVLDCLTCHIVHEVQDPNDTCADCH